MFRKDVWSGHKIAALRLGSLHDQNPDLASSPLYFLLLSKMYVFLYVFLGTGNQEIHAEQLA